MILIAGYLPIQAYCTAPEIFSPAADILAKSLCWIVVGGVLFWLIGQLFSIQGRLNVAGYLFGFLAVLFTVYAFLLPMNVGTIDAFQIADTAPLYQFRNLAVDFAVFSVVGALFVFLVRSGRSKLLQNFFVLCIVAAIGNGTFSLWQSQNKWRDMSHTESVDLPDFNDRLFGFSKTKPNTVVVMLDAFTGTHMRQIVEEFPDIKDAYRGFTWYSDTLATGGNTITSIASMLCGLRCTPEANDAFRMTAEGAVVTATNHNAGINGGIANGMPVVFRTAVKPTPSIYKQQDTVDYIAKKDAQLSIQGRHDPCIVPRAAIVQTCAAALAVGDLLTARYGARWMTDPTGYRKEG